MADEKDESARPLTTGDFVSYCQEKGINAICVSCGKNDWVIVPDMGEGFVALPLHTFTGGFTIPPPHVPTVTAICQRCGYIRCYARNLVLEWRRARGGK